MSVLSISDSNSVYCRKMGLPGVRVLTTADTSRSITPPKDCANTLPSEARVSPCVLTRSRPEC